jgi:hypothetical protein
MKWNGIGSVTVRSISIERLWPSPPPPAPKLTQSRENHCEGFSFSFGSIIRKLTATERNAHCDMLSFNVTHFLFQQALEVLRKTPNNVVLTVCRPLSDVFCSQGPSEPPPPPPPPRRDPAHSISCCSSQHVLPLPPLQTEGPCGVSACQFTSDLCFMQVCGATS